MLVKFFSLFSFTLSCFSIEVLVVVRSSNEAQTTLLPGGNIVKSVTVSGVRKDIVVEATAHRTRTLRHVVEALVNVLLINSKSFNLGHHLTVRLTRLLDCKHVGVGGTFFISLV